MADLYKHIESLGKLKGFKNMTVLCKAAGVPRSTMSELNNGRSKDISKPNAQKFADLLQLSLDEIYGTEGQKEAPTPEGERPITFDDFTYAMQEEAKDLTEMDKQILLSMAKQLNDARKKQNGESG